MDNDQIRQTLESEEQRLTALRDDIRSSDDLNEEQDNGTSGGEIAAYDQHPADAATETQYREINLSELEQIEAELGDVEVALSKLEKGNYGICEVGGEQIEAERLEALPATRYCIKHAGAEQGALSNEAGTSPI